MVIEMTMEMARQFRLIVNEWRRVGAWYDDGSGCPIECIENMKRLIKGGYAVVDRSKLRRGSFGVVPTSKGCKAAAKVGVTF